MAKENTELKSEESKAKTEVGNAITSLSDEQDALLKKRNKRVFIWNGGIVAFLVVISLLGGILGHDWDVAFANLVAILWIGVVTVKELENNHLRWIMGMQQGLHDLERAEMDKFIEAMRPENVIKRADKVVKNAKKASK